MVSGTARAAYLCLLWLLCSVLSGWIPLPLLRSAARLCAACLLAFFFRRNAGLPRMRLCLKKPGRAVALFPCMLAAVMGVAFLTELLFRACSLPLPTEAAFSWESVIAAALLPALAEELIYRGTVLPLLDSKGCVLCSALLFSLCHADFYRMPYAFAAGLFLGYIARLSGSLTLPVLFHFANNLYSLAVGAFPLGVWGYLVPFFLAAVGAFVFFLLLRRDLAAGKAEEYPGADVFRFPRTGRPSPLVFVYAAALLLAVISLIGGILQQ